MMQRIAQFAVAASLASGSLADRHAHRQHQHRHIRQPAGSELAKRDVVTVYTVGETVTVYQLEGETVPEVEAKKGIADGLFVVVGESTPTFTPPPPTTSVASKPVDGQFYESKKPPKPAPTPSADAAAPGPQGLDAPFPNKKIPCTHFPAEFGAMPIDYLGLKGWTGIQRTPNFRLGDAAISFIETAIEGDGCASGGKGAFCSYACPDGYQKTQWPSAQGSTRESIGGLFCNPDGFLELSRPERPQLCERGAGGVYVQNDLDEKTCICRTDYPGTESMTIPTCPAPGQKVPLTNPYSPDYYVWNNQPTTAQYYVNKKGLSVKEACCWKSRVDPLGAGNWAPVNVGVGKNQDGITFISIFPNQPTSTAVLDFNIEIVGDVNAPCSLVNGVYSGGKNGCTTAVTGNGQAIVRFYQ